MLDVKDWLKLGSEVFDLRAAVTDILIVTPIGWALAMLWQYHKRLRKQGRVGADPTKIWIEDLVPGTPVRKATGRLLMRASNDGAVRMIRGTAESDVRPQALERLSAAWAKTSFGHHKSVADSFVTPACTVAARDLIAPRREDDALGVLRDWLRNLEPTEALHAQIRGEGGVGKMCLLHQLFLALAESKGAPVPMLASGSNIEYNGANLLRLSERDKPALQTFVEVWLEVRGLLAKDESNRLAACDAICCGLRDGSIVLLFDGVDELVTKDPRLKDFVNRLLGEVRCSIVTERYEPAFDRVTTRHTVTLHSAWDLARILKYAALRLKDCPNATHVLAVLAQEAPTKNWLSHPDYLKTYLDAVKPLTNEIEMHRLTASRAGVIEGMLQRAFSEAPDQSLEEIRVALSAVAVADAEDPRTAPTEMIADDSNEGRLAVKLKTITRVVERGGRNVVAFQHGAAREYFLSLRIARELLSGPSQWPHAKALHRFIGEPWGRSRIERVNEALTEARPYFEFPAMIDGWLKSIHSFGEGPSSQVVPRGKRNLLDLLIQIKPNSGTDGPAGRLILRALDLRGIDGRGLDLAHSSIEECSFVNANLHDAQLTYARFVRCGFAGADLRRANGIGSVWQECDFGKRERAAKVKDMEVEGAEFSPASVEGERMPGRNVRTTRSRYSGAFGRRFLTRQHTFLGQAVRNLEGELYLPSIERAIKQAMDCHPEGQLILIDLMAGGSPQRTNQLLADFPRLQVLSIDRDAPNASLGYRHKWDNIEFSAAAVSDKTSVDPFAIGQVLSSKFGEDARWAHVIIAKKALHELDRKLQKLLVRSCASALHPGGQLVLFEDAPGPEMGPFDTVAHKAGLQRHEELRDLLLKPESTPDDVRRFVSNTPYPADADGEWAFVNDWISIKDWACLNRREVENRYFASVAELRSWAEPDFDFTLGGTDRYDINPLRFNERGVNEVLHYLERLDQDRREATGDPEAQDGDAIERDRVMLLEMLAGSPKYRALVDITRMVFERSAALAVHMGMTERSIKFAADDPLKALEIGESAPEFKLRCAVVVFTRRLVSGRLAPSFAVRQAQPATAS